MMDPDRIEPVPGRWVGAACFEDEHLRKIVRPNLTDEPCSYYRGAGKVPRGAPLDVVIAVVFEGLCSRYDDAANGVGWEGGYVGAMTWDSYDLVRETVEISERADMRLLDDIAGALPDRTWSEIDPYGARGHQILRWSWERFVNVVKHERRFYFDQDDAEDGESISPGALLAAVASRCRRARLLRRLPAGTIFYRCRARKAGQHFSSPSELGPPPKERASQSRMSPAGIPMFYGAEDEVTARAETLEADNSPHCMAQFELVRAMNVLDLTKSPGVSLFDPRGRSLYDWAIFMHQFRRDLGRSIKKDDRVHIEYVPTQIVTEYFRSFLKTRGGEPIDGILYRSATGNSKTCVALFANAADVDPEPPQERAAGKASGHLLRLLSFTECG